MTLSGIWKRFRRRTFSPSEETFDAQMQYLHAKFGQLSVQIQELHSLHSQLSVKLEQVGRSALAAAIDATPILLQDLHISPTYLNADLPNPILNAGVVQKGSEIIFISRSSTPLVRDDHRYFFPEGQKRDTVNIFHRFDLGLRFKGNILLDDSVLKTKSSKATCGIQDIRLFIWCDALWGIGAGVRISAHDGEPIREQILIKIDDYKVIDFIELASPVQARVEKNWTPIVRGDRLFLIYNYVPMVVFELVDRRLVLVRGNPLDAQAFVIRGGPPLLEWDENTYVGIIHHPSQICHSKQHYTHSFISLSDKFDVLEITPPFFFQRKGIEFACGLIRYQDKLLISYGVSDRASAFALVPVEAITPTVVGIGAPNQHAAEPRG